MSTGGYLIPLLCLTLAFSGCGLIRSKPVTGPTAVVGSWSGLVNQPGHAPYFANVTFELDGAGLPTGRVSYPSLKCDGTYTYNYDDGVTTVFSEVITEDETVPTSACASGGTIQVRRSSMAAADVIVWEWHYPTPGTIAAKAILHRGTPFTVRK